MDAEVEMVDVQHGDDDSEEDVVGLGELEDGDSSFRLSPMQRTFLDTVSRYGLFTVALVFSLAVMALATVSLIPEELYSASQPDDSGLFESNQVKQATDKVKHINAGKHKHPQKPNHDRPPPENIPVVSPTNEDEVEKWLAASVTLDDGKKYEIVDQLKHDPEAFLEGLMFIEGRLFESVGLFAESDLRELDPETGDTTQKISVPTQYFAEGLTYANGKLFQLTYKAKKGFIYELKDLSKPPEEFTFETITGEGWGMTYMEETNELVVSDGSDYLLFWDPETLKETRRVQVKRAMNQSSKQINELEYWRGKILSNVWYKDFILVIDPYTGLVEKEYDFSDLWPKSERHAKGADVLNGISVSAEPDILYITGKKWDRMFKIRLLY